MRKTSLDHYEAREVWHCENFDATDMFGLAREEPLEKKMLVNDV